MIEILTPDQVTSRENQKTLEAIRNMRPVENAVIDALAAHVQKCWQEAQHDRSVLTERLLDCLRRRRGEYSAEHKAAIAEMGGSSLYMKITGAKCSAAKAWINDIFTPSGDRAWAIEPSPVADLPPDIEQKLVSVAVQGALAYGLPLEQMTEILDAHRDRIRDEVKQVAEERCELMSERIHDILVEGGWRQQFSDFVDDLVTFPTAILKAPVYRRKKQVKWKDIGSGQFVPETEFTVCREFRRVSPFDFYPSPSSVDVDDNWVIERHRLTPSDLAAMRNSPGFNAQNIALALNEYRANGLKGWVIGDHERASLEGKEITQVNDGLIDALEWSGKLSGTMLLEWGMTTEQIPDPHHEYLVSIMTVGSFAIRTLLNPDPLEQNDYFVASWRTVPGAFWGESLPELLADCQDMCNASARALANNMGMASAPMIYYMADRLANGSDVENLHPWKLIGCTESRMGSSAPPVGFFQPNSNANELLTIYERFSRYGDEITGLPSYAHGSDQGAGAARTASGLSMLMNSASRSVKEVVRQIDINVIEPCLTKLYHHLMLDNTVPDDAKGDLRIRAIGSEALLHKEASQAMQTQFLAQTANPIDMEIIGLEGRRELLREAAKSLNIPVDRVVPSLEQMQMQQMQQMQQGMGMEPEANNAPQDE